MPELTRRDVLKGLTGAAAAAWLAPACALGGSARPNLLFLLSDDQRWDSLGCTGNPVVETPHLDELARGGTLFREAFVTTSICPSSRASILTGRRAGHTGVFDFDTPIPWQQVRESYPALLHQNGYETAFIGKWGVNANRAVPLPNPTAFFDYWAGAGWQDNYWHQASCRYVVANARAAKPNNLCDCPPDGDGVRGPLSRFGKLHQRDPLHLTTQILPRRFSDFLDTRDASKPFCVSISFKAPHAPIEDWDPRYADLYQNAETPLRPSVSFTNVPTLPAALATSWSALIDPKMRRPEGIQNALRHLYRQISGLDFAVGEMRRALAERGLADDTVVIFSSDNGHLMGEHGLWGKWLMYEESIRVPLIVFDPRQRAPLPSCDAMVLNIDLAPTLCELAGVPVPADLDGRSLVPLLRGERDSLRDEWLYEHHYSTSKTPIARSEGVRTSRWKYLCFPAEEPISEMLFDLEADPYEMRNLAGDPGHAAILAQLRERWLALGGSAAGHRISPAGADPGGGEPG